MITLDEAIKEAEKALDERCLGGFNQTPKLKRTTIAELIIAAKEKAALSN
jgi:hypothetical protein